MTGPAAAEDAGSTPPELPHGALLGAWLGACLRGEVGPDDMADAIRAGDPRHLLLTPDGLHEPSGLVRLLGERIGSVDDIRVVVCAPGDPAGLAGPPGFNASALEAGSAVVVGGSTGIVGLVPQWDARTIVWHLLDAHLPVPLDPAEASRDLRRELTLAATALADAEVIRWQPEIPDLLLNLSSRPHPHLPSGYDADRVRIIDRALVALEIVALTPQHVTLPPMLHPVLARLAGAARRVLVAACSDSLRQS